VCYVVTKHSKNVDLLTLIAKRGDITRILYLGFKLLIKLSDTYELIFNKMKSYIQLIKTTNMAGRRVAVGLTISIIMLILIIANILVTYLLVSPLATKLVETAESVAEAVWIKRE